MITQAPRGTSDWFGDKMRTRTQVEAMARNLCEKFNIKEVITPVFEHTVLFQRGVGETTDVVQKEMYTFVDKGGRSITLKPEGTSGAIRAYVENKLYAEPQPIKMFYITPAFRYEKPESGRLRQHHQFGVEFVGSPNPMAEVEVMTLVSTLIKQIGLSDAKLHINSIGCPKCKKVYNDALISYLKGHEEGLCNTCKERMVKNPLRVIDCKEPGCKAIVKDAPRTIDYLCEECDAHFKELQRLLTELEIPFLLASQCGLRPSEICALTKDCITADGLEIRKAFVINEHGREVYKPPKSYAGYRTIPISPLLRDKLMNTPDKKRICVISSNKISRDWNSFLRKHGLHIFRFYSLRHYYASQALLLGIPQKYIAELMGHSSTDMIEKVYQHTFPSAMEEFKVRIADNIEKLLG